MARKFRKFKSKKRFSRKKRFSKRKFRKSNRRFKSKVKKILNSELETKYIGDMTSSTGNGYPIDYLVATGSWTHS